MGRYFLSKSQNQSFFLSSGKDKIVLTNNDFLFLINILGGIIYFLQFTCEIVINFERLKHTRFFRNEISYNFKNKQKKACIIRYNNKLLYNIIINCNISILIISVS